MGEKVDINQADLETLASLPGIGLKRAAQIVEYRTAVHPFEEVIELAAVPGISERMVRELAEQLTVNGAGPVETAEAVEEIIPAVEEVPVVETIEEEVEQPADEEETAENLVEAPEPVSEVNEPDETEELVEEEPVIVTMLDNREEQSEPEPEPAVSRPAPEIIERRVVETVQRRHFHLWQQFFGVMAGALFGSLLTLLLLFLLNGTLRFAGDSRATDLQLQLDEQSSAIQQSQSEMSDEMGDLSGRVTALDNELATSEEAIGTVEDSVADLEAETAVLNEQIEAIDLAADKFDTFLTGLRDLLVTLQGLPPALTSTTTITGTATISATATPDGTAVAPTATPTAATPEGGAPTRTPRPTATRIIESED